ncbi:hypothetical protein A3C26_00540 [Candidatus Daviesbacteria bacterium RIFCSPHIGHO2_02_FULL_39_12]|uniref:Uncharacterized protein n=1 Tax=Candidatus Daviesbacteria bacterium RIFCSPHIGHO2_02_FULL_39_12 TaxID=1797770 RepID=A0A1F5JD39_9BACT|nr:MAG: hypothetical protein A3C26_00540 [Candidatus Daviesbacteria bacterium RIFCSPHIGHO2_02_FULL_39_12]
MGPLLVSFVFASNISSFNISVNFLDQAFEQPISFIKSLFTVNPLPVQTKDTKSYTIALVGDSMTETLGTADDLREDLKTYYPEKVWDFKLWHWINFNPVCSG